ncbi:MAG: acyl carrier protein [Xanthomonadaceae bacterium]|jgi:acyl carrier protein|nr:acyl carrier protein [Xanthomonadaceae bacterium]
MDHLYEAKKILSGCLFVPIEKIGDDADINSVHQIDSLNFSMIVMEVENLIRAEVDPLEVLELRTVKDLARILERHVQ